MSNVVNCGDMWDCGECCKACFAECVCEEFSTMHDLWCDCWLCLGPEEEDEE